MSMMERIAGFLRGQDSGAPAKRPSTGYMRGGRGVTFTGWRPALRDTQDEIGEAWDSAAARAVDAIQNSGWLAGAVEQAVANTVGTGLRLRPMPENETFGMTNTEAHEWRRRVEQRFELWARNPQECDIEGLRTFGQMQAAAFRSWLATGEILGELTVRRRPWNRYATKLRVLPPHRLSRKSDTMQKLVNGVYLDGDGMPIAYRAIRKDPMMGEIEYDVRARDRLGRPRVVHIFDGQPGTYRGIGPLTPALQVAKQFDQLADATLTAAIVQTLFAATITSDEPTEEVLEGMLTPQERARMLSEGVTPVEAYLDMVAGFYDSATLNVGINGRIAHLFPGQEMKFHTSEQKASDYKEFSQQLLRELARCLGLTYESATGDNQGATYSSLQAATSEIFEITKIRRRNVVAPFCQPAYEAWLEEEIARGDISFPGGLDGFLSNRTAACRADWRGSPRPHADNLKQAKAHEVWKRLGVMSDEMIASELGVDIEDVYEQRAQEIAMRAIYGLPEPTAMGATGGGVAMIEDRSGEDDDDDD